MSGEAAAKMTAPDAGVTVRMYRQGLGDCFLLAFPTRGGGRPCYVLIDCGVLLGTENAAEKMKQVASSLHEATGGKIDVLVATLQHWDHVSGFQQAKEVFDQIEIGQVWAAWTEDPNDPVAHRLRDRREASVRWLHAAAEGLRKGGDEDSASSVESVLGFFGELEKDGRPATLQQAMAYVLGRGNPPRYWRPGDRLELPGVDAARVYVLGPPRIENVARPADPTESSFGVAALAAGSTLDLGEEELKTLSLPFDAEFRIPLADARQDAFFQESYFGVAGQPSEHQMAWRQIDTEWLTSASHFSLQLDSETNNTSLALAVELVSSGKVLLFAADAQEDNWLSWHKLQWPREGEPGGPDLPGDPVTVVELLHRTVLYKVGHHASHNATLEAGGLELMTDPELVAMIPVDEAMAHKPKGGNPAGWDMPFAPLLQSLLERAKGRVLRADSGAPPQSPRLSPEEWKDFEKRYTITPDYVELTIVDPDPRQRGKRK
ncbi:MAG: hypothetical protein WAM82_07840 [Thermoanaerobaculia bacterium]